MPLIDMPLEELKTYQGRNPKPADFDAYWDRALAEMEAVDPNLELVLSDFQVPNAVCYDMYYDGTRGGRVHAKLAKPAKIEGRAPALLHFHGYTGASGDWTTMLSEVCEGFVVAFMDVRGQGGTSIDKNPVEGNTYKGHIIRGLDDPDPDNLFFRQIYLDTALLAKLVMAMDDVDETRVGASGGSQGGALTVACAALTPTLKMASPDYPFLSDYKRVWEMDLAECAYSELKEYFRSFDPTHAREDAIFEKLGYIDLQHLADRIKAKMLFGCGLMDNICPASTQFAIYNKITAPKDMVIYPDFGHEDLPGMSDRKAIFFKELLEK